MNDTIAVVLAAGRGKRMRSRYPKVLHSVGGKPMLLHVLDAVHRAGINKEVVVLGHGKEMILERLGEIDHVVQEQQLGTGHAVYQCRDAVGDRYKNVLVLCGDTPLITADTVKELLQHHRDSHSVATVLTADLPDPEGYGRIVRDSSGRVERIIEQKDASPKELEIREVNSGTYVFNREELFKALEKISADNAQGEYYLTDVIKIFFEQGKHVSALKAKEPSEILGINDRTQLAQVEGILRQRKNEELMLSGVTILDPYTTRIDSDVVIGQDTIIYPFTIVEGNSVIGCGCEIGPSTAIKNCSIGDGTLVKYSVVLESTLGARCTVGPFAHLRPGTVLGDSVKIGDFVEIKKSRVGEGSKVPHLAYVGDAEIDRNVNVGAGTITCNYDGERKWRTIIGEGAFIGSNTSLVAPVEIGKDAFVAAGSTITKNVPEGALGIARQNQKNIEGWVFRNKRKKE